MCGNSLCVAHQAKQQTPPHLQSRVVLAVPRRVGHRKHHFLLAGGVQRVQVLEALQQCSDRESTEKNSECVQTPLLACASRYLKRCTNSG